MVSASVSEGCILRAALRNREGNGMHLSGMGNKDFLIAGVQPMGQPMVIVSGWTPPPKSRVKAATDNT